MYVNKWWSFCAAALIQTCGGLFYCFPLYSNALKHTWGLSQSQVQMLGATLLLGGYMALPGGWLYERLAHTKLGPRVVLWVGCVAGLIGYGGLYAATTAAAAISDPASAAGQHGDSNNANISSSGGVNSPSAGAWALLLMCTFVAGMQGNMFDTSALVTTVRNFPTQRGTVIGALKAVLGLGPSLFASAYHAFLEPDQVAFIAFLAAAPAVIVITMSVFLNAVPFQQQDEHPATSTRRFGSAYIIITVLAIHQVITLLLGLPPAPSLAVAAVLLLVLFVAVAAGAGGLVARRAGRGSRDGRSGMGASLEDSRDSRVNRDGDRSERDEGPLQDQLQGVCDEERALLAQPGPGAATAGTEQDSSDGSKGSSNSRGGSSSRGSRGAALTSKDSSALQLMSDEAPAQQLPTQHLAGSCWHHPEFWLLFALFAVGVGAGLAFQNNLGELVTALGGDPEQRVALVSIFSVGSCSGRLLAGYVPERLMHARAMPRPMHLITTAAVVAVANAATAMAPAPALLYPLALIYGAGFGAHWCLVPAVASEVFGMGSFAGAYAALILAPAFGAYLLSAELAGRIYEAAAHAQGGPPGASCMGAACFGPTFAVLAVLGAGAAGAALVLTQRTRALYARLCTAVS